MEKPIINFETARLHAEVGDHLLVIQETAHVVVIIVPDKCVWTHSVQCPFVAEAFLLCLFVIKILEVYLLPFIDCFRDRFRYIIDLLVISLGVICIKMSTDLFRRWLTYHASELAYQLCALFRIYEPGRWHGINQELDFWDFEFAACLEEGVVPAPDRDNIKFLSQKDINIILYSLSICVGILCQKDSHQF